MQRYGENNDFQIGTDIANDVAENARDTEVLLNVEISEDFDTSNNNFCIFSKFLYCVFNPIFTVKSFFYTKGNYMTITFSACSLIN